MKIAVCFSGHMRKFELTFPSWKNFLFDHYDCDIFIHTWSNRGMFLPKDGIVTSYNEVGTVRENDDPIDPSTIQNLYKPKEMIIEDYNHLKPLISEKSKAYYEWRDKFPD